MPHKRELQKISNVATHLRPKTRNRYIEGNSLLEIAFRFHGVETRRAASIRSACPWTTAFRPRRKATIRVGFPRQRIWGATL